MASLPQPGSLGDWKEPSSSPLRSPLYCPLLGLCRSFSSFRPHSSHCPSQVCSPVGLLLPWPLLHCSSRCLVYCPLSWVTCSLPEASTTPACLSPCCAQHRPQPDQHGTGHQTVKSTATITPRISTAHSNSPQCNQAILACVWWQAGEVCSRHSPHIKLKCACLGAGSVVRLSHRGLSFHVSFGLSSSMQRLRLVWSPWSN